MRSAVTPATSDPSAGTTPPSAASPFARHVRALRVTLALALVIAVPLVVLLATHQSRTASADAYRDQARTEATAVARDAAAGPRSGLDRLRRAHPDVRGVAVYRRAGGR
jgi:hypothetical protein